MATNGKLNGKAYPTESVEKKMARKNATLRGIVSKPIGKTGKRDIVGRDNIKVTNLTAAEIDKMVEKTKVKAVKIAKPGMRLKAIKSALRVGAKFLPQALAAGIIAEAALFAYDKLPKKKEMTLPAEERKKARHGKKSGGPVKSKYSTSNKRYANGGKIYPR
jgi:hypothetical protein